MTDLFLMNWLQIPSHDSQSLSSSIHWQFSCKCMFILCLGLRLHLRAWISQNKDILEILVWAWKWPKWVYISPSMGFIVLWDPADQERALPLILYPMRDSIPKFGKPSVCLLPLHWQPGKPNLWSNTDVVNALHANKMHTVTKSGLKPRKKTCSPWNKLIVTWVHSASEFKRRVVNGVRMNHL